MRVLLAIDTSPSAQDVICEAALRPWPKETQFCILHVINSATLNRFAALIDKEKELAGGMLLSAKEALARAGREVQTEIIFDFPRHGITQFAKNWNADWILVGSHGHSAIARFLLGSVAQAVLRASGCSVEIVRRKSGASMASSHPMRILLGTDGSESALAAVRSVAERPWPFGTEIKIICAVEMFLPVEPGPNMPSVPAYPVNLLEDIWKSSRERARSAVDEASGLITRAGLPVATGNSTPEGDPRVILLDEAKKWNADLVVLGSHGRRGMDRLLMGSVSESLALHAPCSVEVVR